MRSAHGDAVAIIAYYGLREARHPTSDLDIFYVPDEGRPDR
jgi:hypothetical protein